MLIEIWERLRGFDKWIQTGATVEESQLKRTKRFGEEGDVYYTDDSDIILLWIDGGGNKHRASFNVPADSPIYQLIEGETVTIRYDPANPDRFFFPLLLKAKFGAFLRRGKIILLLSSFWLLFNLLRLAFR